MTYVGYCNGRGHLGGAAPQGLQQGQDRYSVQGRLARAAAGRRAAANGACVQRHYVMARRQGVVSLKDKRCGVGRLGVSLL